MTPKGKYTGTHSWPGGIFIPTMICLTAYRSALLFIVIIIVFVSVLRASFSFLHFYFIFKLFFALIWIHFTQIHPKHGLTIDLKEKNWLSRKMFGAMKKRVEGGERESERQRKSGFSFVRNTRWWCSSVSLSTRLGLRASCWGRLHHHHHPMTRLCSHRLHCGLFHTNQSRSRDKVWQNIG